MGYRATRVAMRACQFSWHIAVDLLGDTQAGLFIYRLPYFVLERDLALPTIQAPKKKISEGTTQPNS